MDLLSWWPLLVAVPTTAVLLFSSSLGNRPRAWWLGLRPVPGGYSGVLDGIEVSYGAGEGEPPGWRLGVPTGTLLLEQRHRTRAIFEPGTGDPDFDTQFVVRGDLLDRACLTAPIRELLKQGDVRLREGKLVQHAALVYPQTLLALAHALAAIPSDPSERLRQGIADPVAGVRIRSLLAAFEHDRGLAAELARSLQADLDASVRLAASIVLWDDDLEAAATSSEVRLDLRLRAARRLGEVGSPEQRVRVGVALMIELEPLLQELGRELIHSVGAGLESALVELARSADTELLQGILPLLSEVGSVSAVPILRARQAELSLLHRGLSRAIDEAVLSVQQRSGGQAGGLALAGPPRVEGGLALAGKAGGLSEARSAQRVPER